MIQKIFDSHTELLILESNKGVDEMEIAFIEEYRIE